MNCAYAFDVPSHLPLGYRLFFRYCRLYLTVVINASEARGGAIALLAAQRLASRTHDGYATVAINGASVCLDVQDARFLQVILEVALRASTARLRDVLNEGDTFIDVGANQGGFSIVAAHLVGARGRIIAIEPQPRLAESLRRSLRVSPAQSLVHAVAVGETHRDAILHVPSAYSGMASLHGVFADHAGSTTPVPVQMSSLNTLFDGVLLPGSVFLKIDVEGHELSVLRGARRLIERCSPRILIEVNPRALEAAGASVAHLVYLLEELGYHWFRFWPRLSTVWSLRTLIETLRAGHQCDILVTPFLAGDAPLS